LFAAIPPRVLSPVAGRSFQRSDRANDASAHGFTVRLLASSVDAGFATANPQIVKAGGRTLSMLRLTINDLGRQALAGA
jgi:hypothetical protein